jgi:hypothetical protein
MDELIVGGLKGTTLKADDVSVKTSEGVEVSSKEFAICDAKIDKEIAKLRKSTSREP